MNTFTLKTHHVNSKLLLVDITKFIDGIIDEFSVLWKRDTHRDAILEVIEEFLDTLVESGRITQYNVICDSRNNNESLADAGITNLQITYKQDNCYNTTVLDYSVNVKQ